MVTEFDSSLRWPDGLSIMGLPLETYMEAEKLPETARQLLREEAQHSVSRYGLDGEHLPSPLDKESLLEVIMGMERLLLDSNSLGSLGEAKHPDNQNKAFILGETVVDERENLKELLFGRNADSSNNNLFQFGILGRYVIIHRLDLHHRLIFDVKRLREESRERVKRTDREFLDCERERTEAVSGLKQYILEKLELPDVTSLPPGHCSERKKSQLVQRVRYKAPTCFNNYLNGIEVAILCYAALLLEQDGVGEKTRKEFNDPTRRNVFGDIHLVQNALWLKARIVSGDKAVQRMADYIAMPEITVAEKA